MTSAVLYARYSTAMQSSASVEDQLRLLRQRAAREGWAIAGEHADRAISGTVRDRPGLVDCLAALERGDAQILLSESLDRISRDQEDIAGFYKRVRFHGARIVTLSEGEVGSLHIGMGGTISAVFIEQLATKVRRGQIGRVEAGRIPGGLSYGYRAVKKIGADGELERGLREIDEAQAGIVRRIFAEYADGVSPMVTAQRLNREGVPSPRGGVWRANSITGSRKRRNGILHNDLYRGRLLYNRQNFRKDPDTRKRISRANEPGDLVTGEVPGLRIVDEDLWERVQARLAHYAGKRPEAARRPRRLLSGLMRCGECGGTVTIIAKDRWGCSNHKQSGTCDCGISISNAEAERRIFAALKRELLHPEVIAAYFDELRIAAAEIRRGQIAGRAGAERRLAELAIEDGRIADAVVNGLPIETLRARAEAIAEERSRLRAGMDELPDLEAIIAHPSTAQNYRRRIEDLHRLIDGDESLRPKGRELLLGLVDTIEMMRREDGRKGADLVVHGDLAKLLQIGAAKPSDLTPTVVAGVGFEPTTFRL